MKKMKAAVAVLLAACMIPALPSFAGGKVLAHEEEPMAVIAHEEAPAVVEDVQIEINETNFPDEVFRDYVATTFDTAAPKDVLTSDEIANATKISFEGTPVTTLKGIEYFTALKELKCPSNPDLTELDLSNNTELVKLECSSCTSLSTLNVSGLIDLEKLYCCDIAITELDVSSNLNLKGLSCVEIPTLTKLKLNGAYSLEQIECYKCALTALEFGTHPNLTYVDCQFNQIETLDVTGCPSLISLYCGYNILSRLRISKNPELRELLVDNNPLTDISIYACPYLIEGMQNAEAKKDQWDDNDGTIYEYWYYYYEYEQNGEYYYDYLTFDKDDQFILEAPTYNVTVTTDGNGTASSSVASGKEGTEVTLTANPNPGYQFKEWQVISGNITIEDNKFQIAEADVEIKAIFEAIPRTITVTTDGNGTASASAASGIIGDSITLTATPNEGYQFKEWQVVAGGVTITNNSFVIGTENVEIKAIFEAIPTPEPVKDPSFEDFVERLYTVALGRASEAEGKAFWVDQVVNKGFTGADCARFFLLDAPEFLGRGLTDDQFVEILYLTFFDRASEPDGKAYWLGRLASGSPKADVVNDFIESTEWCNVCATYGVKSGAQWHKATIASKNAIKFATRLYTCCLARDPEADGLNYWSLALTNLEVSGYQAASLFFESPEFQGFNTSNEEYLRRLYTTFMGREPDADGFNYWLGLLNGGTSRTDAMKAFASCPEFQEICNQYGIDRGEI